jgi:hypothetical protein
MGLLDDVDDIQVVAEYMKMNHGYDVAMVVAHSKGSIVACKWICSGSEETSKLEMFVNISGRYRMQVRFITCFFAYPPIHCILTVLSKCVIFAWLFSKAV